MSRLPMPLPVKVLGLLRCPVCHGALEQAVELVLCLECGRRYPVRDAIPVLIASEALTTIS